MGKVLDEVHKPLDHSSIGIGDVLDASCAEIDLELQMVKRVLPGKHLGVDKII
jgi:hypothetical protein